MWLVALKRFPLCSLVPINKAIGCTPSVDHRCREGQQLGWDDYEYEELDIDSAWIFFFAGKEDETKHLLHLTPSQQLNVVRWNPASQNEVWIQYLFYLCFIWMLTAYQKKDVSKTLWCLIPCLAELSLFNCCDLFSCWKQKTLAWSIFWATTFHSLHPCAYMLPNTCIIYLDYMYSCTMCKVLKILRLGLSSPRVQSIHCFTWK